MLQTIVEYTHPLTLTYWVYAHTIFGKAEIKKRLQGVPGRRLREQIQHFFFYLSPSIYLMMCVHFASFTSFTVHHSSSVTFSPLALAFFYSAVIKSIKTGPSFLSRVSTQSIMESPSPQLPLTLQWGLRLKVNCITDHVCVCYVCVSLFIQVWSLLTVGWRGQ